ncbi:MAG: Stp1/IreP family PP2C-type Ser/Thr phosphatase [Anaerolineae bacterium]|nr:Stp1/IreP family PP2C-type Ser/Thr phosphatase [Anaerolineae bacterium]
MDFIRRLLGLPPNSKTPGTAEEEVDVMHGADAAGVGGPVEPVIEVPEDTSPQSIASFEKPTSNSGPMTDKPNGAASETKVAAAESDVEMTAGTRPLPPLETIIPQPGERITFGQLSVVGMVRGNNQDSVLSILSSGTSIDDLPDFGLFVVADGMGGHQEGERASAITTRIVAKHVMSEIHTALLTQSMNDPDRPPIANILSAAVQEANDAVTESIPEGGTTVTTAVILGDLAYIAHVGDSRAYLITEERIEQVTRDHSLVQRLIELDQLTPEEAVEHPQRNVLYRAIGQSESLDVDAITRRLPPRSYLLLCSDGLWNMVSEETIMDIVMKYRDPQTACNELVKLANERGGPDNITVTLVQMPG